MQFRVNELQGLVRRVHCIVLTTVLFPADCAALSFENTVVCISGVTEMYEFVC